MSTIVQDILTQTKALAATTFGATYQELRYVYDVAKNDIRSGRLAYGVRPLSAATSAGVTRVYTMDHVFELVMTDTAARTDSDENAEDALNVMYSKADDLFKAMVNTKISLASTVLNVFNPSISEPEFIDDQKLIVLRMQFTVMYRSALN